MRHTVLALLAAGALAIAADAAAQQGAGAGKGDIAAGKQLFHQRCSICHGTSADGRGTSEEGTYLEPRTVPAADLTALSVKNGGTFPAARVRDAIFNRGSIPAHGKPDMPAWGDAFYELKSRPKVYEARIRDITAYIESIQIAK
jgi:mono/diheme cytochrome c family protein